MLGKEGNNDGCRMWRSIQGELKDCLVGDMGALNNITTDNTNIARNNPTRLLGKHRSPSDRRQCTYPLVSADTNNE